MCAEQKAQKTAARLGGSLKILKENQRLLNWGARRAALRPYFNRLSDDFP